MTVIVSTKTLRARDPDQSASTNPTEITSKRPPSRTSFRVGRITRLTALSVSTREAKSMIALVTSSIWASVSRSET